MAIKQDRRRELKESIGIMIDIAWRNGELPNGENLSDDEYDYIQNTIDRIIRSLK